MIAKATFGRIRDGLGIGFMSSVLIVGTLSWDEAESVAVSEGRDLRPVTTHVVCRLALPALEAARVITLSDLGGVPLEPSRAIRIPSSGYGTEAYGGVHVMYPVAPSNMDAITRGPLETSREADRGKTADRGIARGIELGVASARVLWTATEAVGKGMLASLPEWILPD